jgi:hypothetical protein
MSRVVSNHGPGCPSCGRPTQIRVHDRIRPKHLRQPYFYERWFRCTYKDCKTTLYMQEKYKIWNDNARARQLQRFTKKNPWRQNYGR